MGAFRGRRLDHVRFPYIWLDATYLHVRSDHQVTSKAVVVATGVTEDGRREILGIEIGDSEDEAFWREFLRALKRRGLSGVRLVISDQHAGLVAAIARCFQGAGHQRCRVHYVDWRIMWSEGWTPQSGRRSTGFCSHNHRASKNASSLSGGR